jgi:propionyl-CoA carboxylase alpha chain
VTELITGIDLVEQMIRVAAGETLPFAQGDIKLNGWAIESRLYAEDPYRNFLPSIGRLTRYRPPAESADPMAVIRNDTGVYEGGEISRFYDPMIAKLCAWAPSRDAAIDEMRDALDAFEVEGIGHNIPFLSAVMDNPRFIEGRLTTAFIAEEFEGGFTGVTLDDAALKRVALATTLLKAMTDARAALVSGAMPHHARRLPDAYVVAAQGQALEVQLVDADEARDEGLGMVARMGEDEEATVSLVNDWRPGGRLARVMVDDEILTLKVEARTEGFRIRWRGADLAVTVRPPHLARFAGLMPVKQAADTSRLILCPMPGLLVSLAVEVGQEVQDGQALCTVEAMKMENVLRAERRGVVKKINAQPGASLAVDDVIIEFE